MMVILAEMLYSSVLVYLDDVLVFAKNEAALEVAVRRLFQVYRAEGSSCIPRSVACLPEKSSGAGMLSVPRECK